jgi:hypothetical protein
METGNSVHNSPPSGNLEGVRLQRLEREMKEGSVNGAYPINLIQVPFLDADYFRSLSLGAIWNFCEGPGLQ